MIVLDASAFIDAVDGRAEVAARLEGADIHAPHLLDVEVASALRRLTGTGRLSESRAETILDVLEQADIKRHPHRPLLRSVWALRGRLTADDATYVALAAVLEAPLITTDRKLASLPGLPCEVEAL
ncbi:MAG: type II toxin-antitoxin system VapC family toxin [Acidimicrobiia bacterium]|nr:type II toxin-antitoxin system VapC family toxin [Acidimicrobiia bacterium]